MMKNKMQEETSVDDSWDNPEPVNGKNKAVENSDDEEDQDESGDDESQESDKEEEQQPEDDNNDEDDEDEDDDEEEEELQEKPSAVPAKKGTIQDHLRTAVVQNGHSNEDVWNTSVTTTPPSRVSPEPVAAPPAPKKAGKAVTAAPTKKTAKKETSLDSIIEEVDDFSEMPHYHELVKNTEEDDTDNESEPDAPEVPKRKWNHRTDTFNSLCTGLTYNPSNKVCKWHKKANAMYDHYIQVERPEELEKYEGLYPIKYRHHLKRNVKKREAKKKRAAEAAAKENGGAEPPKKRGRTTTAAAAPKGKAAAAKATTTTDAPKPRGKPGPKPGSKKKAPAAGTMLITSFLTDPKVFICDDPNSKEMYREQVQGMVQRFGQYSDVLKKIQEELVQCVSLFRTD